MESKFQENNPYISFMINNFNRHTKFYRIKKNKRFITWKMSRERACKLLYTLSKVYVFKEKSSLWHKRAIYCRYKLEKVQSKYLSKWDDRFYVLGDSMELNFRIPFTPSLFDITGLYSTTKLNSFVREFKNMKKISKDWNNTYYKIKRSFYIKDSITKIDGWMTSYRRSFRGFLLHDDEWDLKFQNMVKYWNSVKLND